jgi:hypothetical protein
VGFFDPSPPFEPLESVAQPAWIGPPDNVLGVGAPLRLLLGRSDRVAVAITGCTVYASGLLLDVAIRLRPKSLSPDERRAMVHGGPFRAFDVPDDGQVLRLGVLYADGRKATTQNDRHAFGGDAPEGPVFMERGGGGGENAWDMRVWLWPLPPAGPLVFVAEWPTLGIEETRVETDATPLVDAADRVEELWPERGPPGGGGVSGQYVYPRRTTGQTKGE